MKKLSLILILLYSFISSYPQTNNIPSEILDSLTSNYHTYIGNYTFTDSWRGLCYIPWTDIKIKNISLDKINGILKISGTVINSNTRDKEAIPDAKILIGYKKEEKDTLPDISIGNEKKEYGEPEIDAIHFTTKHIFYANNEGDFEIEIILTSEDMYLCCLFPEETKGIINVLDDDEEKVYILTWVNFIQIGKLFPLINKL